MGISLLIFCDTSFVYIVNIMKTLPLIKAIVFAFDRVRNRCRVIIVVKKACYRYVSLRIGIACFRSIALLIVGEPVMFVFTLKWIDPITERAHPPVASVRNDRAVRRSQDERAASHTIASISRQVFYISRLTIVLDGISSNCTPQEAAHRRLPLVCFSPKAPTK